MSQKIYGVHPVHQALSQTGGLEKVFILKKQSLSSRIENIIALAKKLKIQFRFEDSEFFSEHCGDVNHQGVMGFLKKGARFIEDFEGFLKKLPLPSVILAVDHVTDPHNFGAITRNAWFFGASLIISEEGFSAPVDATVHKVSSGASLLMPYYKGSSLQKSLEFLKSLGYKIYAAGLDDQGENLKHVSFDPRCVLVLGAEGKGIRPHILRTADKIIKIEGQSGFDSLNVSAASAVLLYESSRKAGQT